MAKWKYKFREKFTKQYACIPHLPIILLQENKGYFEFVGNIHKKKTQKQSAFHTIALKLL